MESHVVAGNRTSKTDARGITSSYTYDALNRLTPISYPTASEDVHYYYDEPDAVTGCSGSYPVGHLTRMTDGSGSTVYCYDGHGNVVGKMRTIVGNTYTTTYAYNLANRLMGVGYPDGASVAYTRDVDGRVASVTATTPADISSTVISSISYLPFGPANDYAFGPTGYGNDQTLIKTFDHAYRPTGVTSVPLYLQYTLDAVGNPVALTDEPSHHATPVESYQYDPLYRLQQVDDATGTPWQSYTYDKTGDRLTKTTDTVGGGTDSYQYQGDTHRLIDITGATPSARAMDANGNTTAFQANGWTYALGYGDDDRLALVQQSGSANTTAYTINGRGERAVKTATTYTVIRPPVCTDPPPVQHGAVANSCPPIQVKSVASDEFDYDAAGKLLSESAGGASRDYVWAGNTLVAVLDTPAQGGDTLHYVYTDGLGTPRAITTPDGTEVWDWPAVQNPFGERAASGNGYTFNLRFPGQYFDAETGLHYNMFRDYEPATGRYIQSDPIGLQGGISTYGYAYQNPFLYTDSYGEFPITWDEFGVAAGRAAAVDAAGLGPEDLVGDAAAVAVGVATLVQAVHQAEQEDSECQNGKKCPPCSPYPKGTIGYIGPHTDHDHYPIGRPHLNLYVVNQNPDTCKCFWNKNNPDATRPPSLPGWVDLNGGFPTLTP